jgi:hypothetical protein
MEIFTSRPYSVQTDRMRVEDLLLAYRVATCVDSYPTIWRFRLLLSSRVWQPAHDTCIWEDGAGRIVCGSIVRGSGRINRVCGSIVRGSGRIITSAEASCAYTEAS